MGLGGEGMERQGVELLAPLEDLAVMGFAEVVTRLPFFVRLGRYLDRILKEEQVDLVLPIDYPGFNLRMAKRAWKRGIPVLYYIAPQVWAWKPRRAKDLARYCDRVAVILPFEVEILKAAGADVRFVGHPLVDREPEVPGREEFCATNGFDPHRPILALFPGSRRQELERHVPLFREVASRLTTEHPDLQVGLARAAGVRSEDLSMGDVRQVPDGRALLRYSRAALVKSGTTTLEAAIEGTPFVTVYRTHPLTFALAQRLVKVDHVALANLVVGRRVVPELLQGEATAGAVVEALSPLLEDSERRREVVAGLQTVREHLGSPGAAKRVAALATELLEPSSSRAGR